MADPRQGNGRKPRAAYPQEQDAAAQFLKQDIQMYPQQSASAPYPDLVYQQQTPPQYAPKQPQRPAPLPRPQPTSQPRTARRNASRKTGLWLMIVLVCTGILVIEGYIIVQNYSRYAPFRAKVKATQQTTFASGVYVDGVHIGGMTRSQAEAALAGSQAHQEQNMALSVTVDNYSWTLTPSQIPYSRNTSSVLDRAYAIGKASSPLTVGASTPMQWRYDYLQFTAKNQAQLATVVTYDRAAVRDLVAQMATYVNRDAQDAQVATFDFDKRTFTFTQEVAGAVLDTDYLYNAIVAQLDAHNFTAKVQVSTTSIMPKVTRVELMNSFAKVSSFTTDTTSNANRNTNINLAAIAVSRTEVKPGETFSFNETTGQRTAAKGYLMAAAIAGGTTVEEIGGGVCQVSSTLFNAVAMADLEIVYRSPHTWPSTYVDKGRDATVNWPNLDFKFKNNKDTPIYIVAYYQNRKCTVEIYGVTLGAGVTIKLETKTTSITEPPSEPIRQQNKSLAAGTEQVLKEARTGYTVDTYRVYLRNGVEYNRVLLCTSTYKMIQQVIEYN